MKYSLLPIEKICPICGHKEGKVLYTARCEDVAKHFLYTSNALSDDDLKKLSTHISNTLWNSETAKVIKCKSCDFCYADPFIAGDYLFYNLMTHGEAEQADSVNANWDWEFEEARKKIEKLAEKDKQLTLLEMGASTGGFIKRIVGEFVEKENILCLEYSEVGVNEIKKLGIEAISKDIRNLTGESNLKNKFNIICLFQVFEHLDNYDKLFEAFDYLTTNEADLFIAVPNGERIKFNELNGGLLDFPPNHLGRFNRKSFELMSKKYNWVIEDFKIQDQTYQQIFGGLLYYRSLQRKIVSDKEFSKFELLLDYIKINIIKIKIFFKRREIGDNIFVHLKKVNK